MPDILIRRTLAANEIARPFGEADQNWRFRRCPYPRGLYTILLGTTAGAAQVEHSVLIGTTEVVQRSDTSVGFADGVMPTPFTAPAHQFFAAAGDEIILELEELAGVATSDVMIWANVEPA